MEPLNTFFKISPSLLGAFISTPRSRSSSSFSSPSFADHQTGLKLYRGSPASLCCSPHQVVDDNPLFEGFPVLPNGSKRMALEPPDKAKQLPSGDSEELQEQLHHLVIILQHALELHSANGLPDGMAPQLADELEAMAKKLKEKEREAPVERHLRSKVQAVLTGAAATIQKLRATPTPGQRDCVIWHSSGAYEASPIGAAAKQAAHTISNTNDPVSSRCGGAAHARDPVCKQLLQSPCSIISPLSWKGPAPAAASPLLGADGTRMVSPKELPTESHWSNPHFQPSDDAEMRQDQLLSARTLPSARTDVSDPAGMQPALYSWMKACLASASKQTESSSQWDTDSATIEAGTVEPSPRTAEVVPMSEPTTSREPASREGLEAAVRTALTTTQTPLVYGTPLHRRIQRLLADRRSPSPMCHASSQVGDLQESTRADDDGVRLAGLLATPAAGGPEALRQSECSSRLVWEPAPAVVTEVAAYETDTTSSCDTPLTAKEGDLTALQFRSCISPFGPTLRERYAAKANVVTSTCEEGPSPTATAQAFVPLAINHDKEAEAAALVAELGLDLPLDPATEENISKLEVLEHVERWARGQYIAAKRALASVSPEVDGVDDKGSREVAGVDCAAGKAVAGHPLVDMAVQTDTSDSTDTAAAFGGRGRQWMETRDAAVGTSATPRPCSGKAASVPVSMSLEQLAKANSMWQQSVGHNRESDPTDDNLSDICSPARADQLKRSPARAHFIFSRVASPPATYNKTSVMRAATEARNVASAGITRKHPTAVADFGSPQARRGLFPAPAGERASGSPGPRPAQDESGHMARDVVAVAAGAPNGPAAERPAAEALTHEGRLHDSVQHKQHSEQQAQPLQSLVKRPQCLGSDSGTQEGARPVASHPQPSCTGRTKPVPTSDEVEIEVMLTPGGNQGSAGRRMSRAFPATGGGCGADTRPSMEDGIDRTAHSASAFVRAMPENLPAACDAGLAVASPVAGTGRFAEEPSLQRGEAGAEILFTPGNSQPDFSGKPLAGKRLSRVFAAVALGGDSEVQSAKTLSSISSVSIIEFVEDAAGVDVVAQGHENSCNAAADNAPDTDGQLAVEHSTKVRRRGRSHVKPSLKRSLRGLIMKFISCTHKTDAM